MTSSRLDRRRTQVRRGKARVIPWYKLRRNPDAPGKVHEGPIDQSWGTREFYVDDPDGNTLRFIQHGQW